ncbi:MAG: hypothetical protein LC745_12670, partial [Planctomycetia bacterium]|nr:hypothetical protein [Planctomycetia bacterium]
ISGVTLDAYTLDSPIDLTTHYDYLQFLNGLTVNTTLLVGDALGATYTSIYPLDAVETIGGTGKLVFGANASNGIRGYGSGAVLTIGPGLTVGGQSGSLYVPSGVLVNQGTIAADAAGGTIVIGPGATFTNSGTVAARNGGTVVTSGRLSNLSGDGTLSGGTWNAASGGTLKLPSGVVHNSASVTIDGAASSIPALATMVSNQGSFSLFNGAHLAILGPTGVASFTYSNTGTLDVGRGATLSIGDLAHPAGFDQYAGTTSLDGGRLAVASGDVPGNVALDAGSLTGSGTVDAHVFNGGGRIVPGAGGPLVFAHTFQQQAPGEIDVALGGTRAVTDYGQLVVLGNASLGGALVLTNAAGYAPGPTDVFRPVLYGANPGATGFGTFTPSTPGQTLSVGGSGVTVLPAGARSLVVTTTADSGPGSLRDALNQANALTPAG